MVTRMTAPDRRVVLMEYLQIGRELVVFGVHPDWPRPAVRVVNSDMDELTTFVAANFDSYRSVRDLADMPELWHTLDELVRPLADWSEPGDVIYLVPYGPLHRLPLHALRLGNEYLIERNPVAYVPSVSALRHSLGSRRPVDPARQRVAVFGDSRHNLPHAAQEANTIAALWGVQPKLGEQVTRQEVTQALTDMDIVHVAGHAGFDPARPVRSGIELAGHEVLTAAEVFGLPGTRASLVTLSGCETGVSQNRPGDELIGLTRAFLYARASSVLVSLWSVADESTEYFMSRFYENLLGTPGNLLGTPGHGKADAFQAAMTDTMRVSGWASLYHWAPFALIGDWR
jgi:CHAT domain-containing protein